MKVVAIGQSFDVVIPPFRTQQPRQAKIDCAVPSANTVQHAALAPIAALPAIPVSSTRFAEGRSRKCDLRLDLSWIILNV